MSNFQRQVKLYKAHDGDWDLVKGKRSGYTVCGRNFAHYVSVPDEVGEITAVFLKDATEDSLKLYIDDAGRGKAEVHEGDFFAQAYNMIATAVHHKHPHVRFDYSVTQTKSAKLRSV